MIDMGISRLIWFGSFVVVLFVSSFMIWSFMSPLRSAIIAAGEVSIESKRKTVQHLEGGIIKKIQVKEGDFVQQGQPVIILDDTDIKVKATQVENLLLNLIAKEARLIAERDNNQEVIPPKEFLLKENMLRTDILRSQIQVFKTRKMIYLARSQSLKNKIKQFKNEEETLNKIVEIEEKRLSLIKKDILSNQSLTEKGYASQSELLRLQRESAEIENAIIQNQINILRNKQKIEETTVNIKDIELNRMKEIVEELREIRKEKVNYEEEKVSIQHILDRTIVRSPISGMVMNLQVFTEEGVISAGQPLLDIVPMNELMIIEAKILPADIDQVRQGMPAQIILPALSMKKVKPLDGELLTISHDSLKDDHSGMSYYLAQIRLLGDLEQALQGYQLYAGMHAEVMLLGESITPIEYLIDPIKSSFNRAFREH